MQLSPDKVYVLSGQQRLAASDSDGFFTTQSYGQSLQLLFVSSLTPNGQTWFLLLTFAVHQSCSVGNSFWLFSLYGHNSKPPVAVSIPSVPSVLSMADIVKSVALQELFNP